MTDDIKPQHDLDNRLGRIRPLDEPSIVQEGERSAYDSASYNAGFKSGWHAGVQSTYGQGG